jgi:myosin heavy subunit
MAEEDMDLEEEQEKDDPVKKKMKLNPDKLREESEEWACQAQTYRNEVESVKADMKSELETKEQQIKILQQTLQGMQLQLLEAQKKSGNLPGFLLDSQEKKVRVQDTSSTKDKLAVGKPEEVGKEQLLNTSENDPTTIDIATEKEKEPPKVKVALAGEDARLVAVISTFLNVHPFGAGTDYIWSYLLRVDPSITYKEVEELLEKYSTCFTMEVEGIGATMSRMWKLIAFQPDK